MMAVELTKEFGVLVIPGIELGKIKSGKHIVALNLDEVDVDMLLRYDDPYRIVKYISEMGGLSIAVNPVPRGYGNFSEIGVNAVEMINGGCARNNRHINNPCKLPEIGCSDAHIKCHAGSA